MAAKLWTDEKDRNGRVLFFCPGCWWPHVVIVRAASGPVWEWNGSEELPTFAPSILCWGHVRCHSFVREGRIEYLADCDHALAGQTIDLPDFTWSPE